MTSEVEVLIVGAGPAGLAAAIELGTRGVRVLLVERNPRVGAAPRAKTTNVRTRTHLRRWGIADELAAEAPFGVDYPNNMVFVTRLSGHEMARFSDAFNASPMRSDYFPEHAQWVPQYKLEKVLLDKARSLPSVDLRFDTEFVTATQDPDGVTATLRATNTEFSVRSLYLIGADGARSSVRDLIGAKMQGQYGLTRAYNIIFRAPGLKDAHSHGPAAIYWQINPQGFSAVGPMDRDDIWFFVPAGMPGGKILSDEEAAAMIRERTGIDLPFEILSSDQWTASELLADYYAEGRIILAGDACHLHPPAGGYGMNMGVGDGVDLGWKIAATLQGWGGPGLIQSYAAERRPVHRAVIDEAVANFAIYVAPAPENIEDDTPAGAKARADLGSEIARTKSREFNTLGTVLGLGYEDSPIICSEDGDPPEHDSEVYTPTARPGYLAPHAWLAEGQSLYDLFGEGFTLLVAKDAEAKEVERATEQTTMLKVPITLVQEPEVPVVDLYKAKLVLIRPDQMVAWRGDRWDESILPRVTGGLSA